MKELFSTPHNKGESNNEGGMLKKFLLRSRHGGDMGVLEKKKKNKQT